MPHGSRKKTVQPSITALVAVALAEGFQGNATALAEQIGVDRRRIYAARYYLKANPQAGTGYAQPGKRRDCRPGVDGRQLEKPANA